MALTARQKLLVALIAGLLPILLAEAALQIRLHFFVRSGYRDHYLAADYGPELAKQCLANEHRAKRVFHPFLGYILKPGQKLGTLSTNSLGLRGPEIAPLPRPGRLRILFFGGSIVFGSGASSDATTIPARLEEYLIGQGVDCEVVNCGLPGYSMWQEWIQLTTELDRLKPGLAVFLNGYNDALGFLEGLARFPATAPDMNYHYAHPVADGLQAILGRSALLKAVFDLYRSRTLRAERPELIRREVTFAKPFKPGTEPDLARRSFARFQDQVRSFSSAQGFQSLFVLQPSMEYAAHAKELTSAETEIQRSIPPARAELLTRMYDSLREIHTDPVETLDLTTVFQGLKGQAYADPAHLNDRGNKALARAVGEHLIRARLVRPKLTTPQPDSGD